MNPSKSAKQQALKAVTLLRGHLPLERSKMKLRLTVPAAGTGRAHEAWGFRCYFAPTSLPAAAARLALRARLNDAPGASIDDEGGSGGATYVVDVTCDPGLYRALEEEVTRVEGGGGSLEVLSLRAAAGEDGGAGGGHGGSGGADDDDDPRDVAARPVGSGSSSAGSRAVASGAVSTDAVAAAARGTGMVVRRVTQPGARLHCNSCDVHFDGPEAHRAHFRSDLHRWVGEGGWRARRVVYSTVIVNVVLCPVCRRQV